ncbi:MAG: flavodoxin family protein [Planctomycetota bacterium]
MKITGITGSPRKGGNTEICIDTVLSAAEELGAEVEHIKLYEHNIARGCTACGACGKSADGTCPGVKDDLNKLLEIIYSSDAIVAGSPVYFGSATPELMAVLQRMGYVARRHPDLPLSGKVLGGVAVARRAGQIFTVDQITNVGGPLNMSIAGSTYWPIAFGGAAGSVKEDGAAGSVKEDEEGIKTMQNLGKSIFELINNA